VGQDFLENFAETPCDRCENASRTVLPHRKGRVGEGTEGRTTEEARKGGTEGPRVLAGWPRRERRGSENDIADIAATRYEQRDLH
jgi:hypothetical protein